MPPENSTQAENMPTRPLPSDKLQAHEVEKTDLEKTKEKFEQAKSELGKLLDNLNVNEKGFKNKYKDACAKLADKFSPKEIEQLLVESNSKGDKHVDYRALNHVTEVNVKVRNNLHAPLVRFYFRIKETPALSHFEGVVKKGKKIQMD